MPDESQRRHAGPLDRLVRSSPLRPIRLRWYLIGIVAIGVLWRVWRYGLAFPIWGDEAFVAVNLFERDFSGMIRPLVYGQIVPLVFMWVELAISRALGLSEYALRLVPFLAGIAALLLFVKFAARALPRRSALLAVAVFAVSYYLVRHAAEVKPYATDLLVSLSMTYLAWGLCLDPRSRGRWVALLLLGAAAPWLSYPSIFIGGAIAIILLARALGGLSLGIRARFATPLFSAVGLAIAFGLLHGLSYAAMYAVYGQPHAEYAAQLKQIEMWERTFPPYDSIGKFLIWFAAIHTGNMFAYPFGGAAGGSAATFLIACIGAWTLWERRPALAALLLVPFALTFVAASLKLYPYGGSARTSLYLAPAICLMTGLGGWRALRGIVALLSQGRPPGPGMAVGLRLIIVGLAIGGGIGMYRDWREPAKDPAVMRSYRTVRDVAAQVQPRDRWIIFNAIAEVPWAPNLAEWRGTGAPFVFDSLRFSPVAVEWSPDPATVATKEGGRVWLLAYRGVREPFPQEQLDSYVATVSQRLGKPVHRWNLIKEKKDDDGGVRIEGIDVFRFGP